MSSRSHARRSTDELTASGAAPYAIPIGGSTATGVGRVRRGVGRVARPVRRRSGSRRRRSCTPRRAAAPTPGSSPARRCCEPVDRPVPEVLAIGVAKGVNIGMPDIVASRRRHGRTARSGERTRSSVATSTLDPNWIGDDYARPDPRRATRRSAGRPATAAGCSTGSYSGKGFAGLVGNAEAGRWPTGRERRVRPHRRHAGGVRSRGRPAGCDGSCRSATRSTDAGAVASWTGVAMNQILDVDLLAFENSTGERRRAVVDGVAPQSRDRLRLHPSRRERRPARHGVRDARRVLLAGARDARPSSTCRVHTARRATPACWSRRRRRAIGRTGRRCSTGHRRSRRATRCKRKFPTAYPDQVTPEAAVPGHHRGAVPVPRRDRRPATPVPPCHRRGHRVSRDVLRRHGHATAPR